MVHIFTTDRIIFYLLVGVSISFFLSQNYQTKLPPFCLEAIEYFKLDLLHNIIGIFLFTIIIEGSFSLLGIIFFPKQKKNETNKYSSFIKQSQLQSRAKTFPPPYPNGWYRLLNSEELKRGEVKHVHLCGTHFAVFRGKEDGKAFVLNAFCPHLGANIAVGGKVEGNTIQCPFHGWKFNGEGECVEIPYAQCVPNFAKTESYPVLEYANMICVYYDIKKRKPTYQPDLLPEIDSGKFSYKGEWAEEVDMHIQDFSENSADFAHFDYLHAKTTIPILKKFIYIKHKLEWKSGSQEENKECFSYFYDKATLYSKPGIRLPRIVDAEITFNGPAGIVYFRFITAIGDVLLIKTFQPLAPLTQLVQDRYYADPKIPAFIARFICREALNAFTDDIFVWANKSYSFKPMLVKEDGPLKAVRRWYSQFYCDESVSMADALNINPLPPEKRIDW